MAGGILAVAAGLVGAMTLALAQQPVKMFRVGWLSGSNLPADVGRGMSDFQQGLRDLGYVEGQNLLIVYRYGDGDAKQFSELAADLVRYPVDVIVAAGEPAALAAKRVTRAVPIVATEFGLDPVKAGLIASFGRPEGNVTGLASISEDLWQKRLALLKEVAPRVTRVMVLWNPSNPGNVSCAEELKAAAPTLGLQLVATEVSDAKTLERALTTMARTPLDALATCWDNLMLAHAKEIADFALRNRMPTFAPLKEFVQAGALFSLGVSLRDQRRRAAYYVNKILKGTKPADLPVERPTRIELVVNITTAKALGITLPPSVGIMADELIE